jgi:hypothetical protein
MYVVALQCSSGRRCVDSTPAARSCGLSAVAFQGLELCLGILDCQLCFPARNALVRPVPPLPHLSELVLLRVPPKDGQADVSFWYATYVFRSRSLQCQNCALTAHASQILCCRHCRPLGKCVRPMRGPHSLRIHPALRSVLLHLDDPASKARRVRDSGEISGAGRRSTDDTLCSEVQAGYFSRT